MNYEFTKNFIFSLLRKELEISDYERYLKIFDQYYHTENKAESKNISLERLSILSQRLTEELPIRQRIIIILYLLKFNRLFKNSPLFSEKETSELEKAIRLTSVHFKIDTDEFENLNAFLNNEIHNINSKQNLIIVGEDKFLSDIRFIERKHLSGLIKFYYIGSLNVFLFYLNGSDELRLNSIEILPYTVYFFSKSSLITGKNIESICFNDLLKQLIFSTSNRKICISGSNISFKYKNSDEGLQKFNFYAESGQFIGILGKSGSGKSTLMRLLTGNLKPAEGNININGQPITEHLDLYHSIIGYVPQYDTLISELTAYQNLFFYTKLWDNSLTDNEIDIRINNLFSELELDRISNRVVGTEVQKNISGGERKRLNLALELIRNPRVLYADEPTSGLSSSDSETLIRLLHEQVLKGRLIIITIHQPSESIFKTFDKIFILDTGGYPVYYGNPLIAADTLINNINTHSSKQFDYTSSFGVNAENIFQVIEQKKVDRYGLYTHERKMSPQSWYTNYLNSGITDIPQEDMQLPELNKVQKCSLLQWQLFFRRNIITKVNDHQYLAITILTSPVLAFILSFLIRNSTNETGGYIFYYNNNFVSFLFISVIVSLFTGLLTSAEEIHRDKLVNTRESLLKLSRNSYLLSKVAYLFLVSALQMMLYILVAWAILEIDGPVFKTWLVLWILSCSANMVGLVLSAVFKSVVTIYIFIPIVLIPQILLSGTVIKFENIHNSLSSKEYVPVVGDLMPSRWAFEALCVEFFKYGKESGNLFDTELQISNTSYLSIYLIPEISNHLSVAESGINNDKAYDITDSLYIANGIDELNNWFAFINKAPIKFSSFSQENIRFLKKQLNDKREFLRMELTSNQAKKDKQIEKNSLNSSTTDISVNYGNKSLTILLLNMNDIQIFRKENTSIVRTFEPIFQISADKYGRAHLFAPYKKLDNSYFHTFYFNLLAICLMLLTLYIILFEVFTIRLRHNDILTVSK